MRGSYLLALIISISGLALIDYRHSLALFVKTKQTMRVLAASVLFLIVWDIVGIKLGIFFIGKNELLIGLRVGQFPVEELFFLLLLSYCSLITFLVVKRLNERRTIK